MLAIRKFVGYTGAAAGIGAALALAMSAQPAAAAAPANRVDQPALTTFTPSAECTAAINAIKDWVRADAAEDNSERMAIRSNPTAGDPDTDATERATITGLFTAARTACAPAAASSTTTPTFTKFTPSAQCSAAIQALKAAWALGRPATQAQWMNIQTLGMAVRSSCGWSWSR